MNKYQEALDYLKKINLRSDHYVQFEEDNIENVCEEEIKILQELVDKETPKKPIPFLNSLYKCENCKGIFQNYHYQNRCPNCGQALDWEQ